jgi:hypothetical protein
MKLACAIASLYSISLIARAAAALKASVASGLSATVRSQVHSNICSILMSVSGRAVNVGGMERLRA